LLITFIHNSTHHDQALGGVADQHLLFTPPQ